jgi:hypothetical protein
MWPVVLVNLFIAALLENFDLDEDEKLIKQYQDYAKRARKAAEPPGRYDWVVSTRAHAAHIKHKGPRGPRSAMLALVRRLAADKDKQSANLKQLPKSLVANVRPTDVRAMMPEGGAADDDEPAVVTDQDGAPLLATNGHAASGGWFGWLPWRRTPATPLAESQSSVRGAAHIVGGPSRQTGPDLTWVMLAGRTDVGQEPAADPEPRRQVDRCAGGQHGGGDGPVYAACASRHPDAWREPHMFGIFGGGRSASENSGLGNHSADEDLPNAVYLGQYPAVL